jgi:cell shape-determining protein MreC
VIANLSKERAYFVQHTADLENVIQKLQVENTQLADKLNLKSTLEERNLVLKEQVSLTT